MRLAIQPIGMDYHVELNRDGKYCLVGRDILEDGVLGVIKSQLGTFDDPVDLLVHYYTFSSPVVLAMQAMAQLMGKSEQFEKFRNNIAEQLKGNTPEASTLRKWLKME